MSPEDRCKDPQQALAGNAVLIAEVTVVGEK
jgi:hypothetical protein